MTGWNRDVREDAPTLIQSVSIFKVRSRDSKMLQAHPVIQWYHAGA